MGCGGSKAANAGSELDSAREASTPKKRASLAATVANPVSSRRLLSSPAMGPVPVSAPGLASLASKAPAEPTSGDFIKDSIAKAEKSGELDLGHPDGKVATTHSVLTAIPTEVFGERLCSSLTVLRLAGNNFQSADLEGISNLKSLKVLDLSRCKINALPTALPPQLEELLVSENNLSSVPALPSSLKVLTLFKNSISSLPDDIGACKQLTEINLFNNKLTALPPSIVECTSLEDVNFGGNSIASFPEVGDSWPSCHRLALQWNPLGRLASLSGLRALATLQVDGCGLVEWPRFDASASSSLRTIDASKNKLTSVSLTGMSGLTKLDLSTNELRELPDDLGECSALETLTLSNNRLVTLPSTIGGCKALKALIGQNNAFKTLPASLGTGCPALTRLVVDKNPELDGGDAETLQALSACRKKCSGRDGRFRVDANVKIQ